MFGGLSYQYVLSAVVIVTTLSPPSPLHSLPTDSFPEPTRLMLGTQYTILGFRKMVVLKSGKGVLCLSKLYLGPGYETKPNLGFRASHMEMGALEWSS